MSIIANPPVNAVEEPFGYWRLISPPGAPEVWGVYGDEKHVKAGRPIRAKSEGKPDKLVWVTKIVKTHPALGYVTAEVSYEPLNTAKGAWVRLAPGVYAVATQKQVTTGDVVEIVGKTRTEFSRVVEVLIPRTSDGHTVVTVQWQSDTDRSMAYLATAHSRHPKHRAGPLV